MQYTSNELKTNANDCAQLAKAAKSDAERARYALMEKAWLELANAQAWLDGEHSPLDGGDPAANNTTTARLTEATG